MAPTPNRRIGDLRNVTLDEVQSAGILDIEELPAFSESIEQNFSGEKRDVLTEVADSLERGEGVPESAVDPDLRAREPGYADSEGIRKRLAGEAGTPSDNFDFKTQEDATFSELAAAESVDMKSESDAFIEQPERDFDTLTQEQVHIEGDRVEKAREFNREERSARERSVDEQYNAPTTTDLERWEDKPNRFDFPGVDTIPQKTRQERASSFAAKSQETGLVDQFEIGTGVFGEGNVGTRGNATGRTVQVDTSRAFDASQTLAHEVGHKVEETVRERDGTLFDNESDKEAAKTLSTQLRGFPDDPYRQSDSELFADAVAASALSPRRVERDAPKFAERLDESLDEPEKNLFPDRLF